MDNEAEAKIKTITDAVQGLATLLDKDGAFCTSWVLVSEWMDSEGNLWFSTHAEPDGPVWRVNGMLTHAIGALLQENYNQGGYNEGSPS